MNLRPSGYEPDVFFEFSCMLFCLARCLRFCAVNWHLSEQYRAWALSMEGTTDGPDAGAWGFPRQTKDVMTLVHAAAVETGALVPDLRHASPRPCSKNSPEQRIMIQG